MRTADCERSLKRATGVNWCDATSTLGSRPPDYVGHAHNGDRDGGDPLVYHGPGTADGPRPARVRAAVSRLGRIASGGRTNGFHGRVRAPWCARAAGLVASDP